MYTSPQHGNRGGLAASGPPTRGQGAYVPGVTSAMRGTSVYRRIDEAGLGGTAVSPKANRPQAYVAPPQVTG